MNEGSKVSELETLLEDERFRASLFEALSLRIPELVIKLRFVCYAMQHEREKDSSTKKTMAKALIDMFLLQTSPCKLPDVASPKSPSSADILSAKQTLIEQLVAHPLVSCEIAKFDKS